MLNLQLPSLRPQLQFGATKLEQPIWVYLRNNGDGGASAVGFKNKADAERVSEVMSEKYGESFTDDVDRIVEVYDNADEFLKEYE